MVGQPFTQLLDPDQVQERIGSTDHATVFAALTASIGQVEEANRDWWWIDADGGRRVVSMSLSATGTVVSTQVGFLCVGRDVTEQRRAQDVVVAALEQQRTAVERLRAIDEAKNEFVSTVSHELRTPVTSIVGYTEMLRDGTLVEAAPEQAPVLERIARNGERLIVLCNDLLMLSGLDSGAITWQAQDVDLAAVMRAVEGTTPGLLQGRDLNLVWEQPARPAVVVGDGEQLERVLLNLVSNAVKFTEDGGVVRVRLDIGPADAVLVVTDTGIGIPDDEQAEVFEPVLPLLERPARGHPGHRPGPVDRGRGRGGPRRHDPGPLRAPRGQHVHGPAAAQGMSGSRPAVAQARLTALMTAFSDAVTMLASIPTPQKIWSRTEHSTYAAASASPPADRACSA